MMFKVNSISECDINSNYIDCTVLKSFIHGAGENKDYRIILERELTTNFGIGDLFKVIMYSENKLETPADYSNFIPIGRRIEIKHHGEDVWNLVTMEMTTPKKID